MENDKKQLEILYEETTANKTDYLLLESVENFDWDYFWSVYTYSKQNVFTIYEKFELVESSEKSDIYKIETSNGMVFDLSVNLLNNSEISDIFMKTLVGNLADRTVLNSLGDSIKNTRLPILNINFKDSDGGFQLTGKVGNYSFSVINGIKKSIIQTVHNRFGKYPDILFFYIDKKEDRKLEFFKNVFKNIFPNFKNQYIDTTNPKYNLVWFF
jgi:hypothetical protein